MQKQETKEIESKEDLFKLVSDWRHRRGVFDIKKGPHRTQMMISLANGVDATSPELDYLRQIWDTEKEEQAKLKMENEHRIIEGFFYYYPNLFNYIEDKEEFLKNTLDKGNGVSDVLRWVREVYCLLSDYETQLVSLG